MPMPDTAAARGTPRAASQPATTRARRRACVHMNENRRPTTGPESAAPPASACERRTHIAPRRAHLIHS